MQPSASRLLADLATALDGEGVRWYVFGAQAVNVYGMPRMTADVDVTVEWPHADAPRLVALLANAGFVLRVEDPTEFLAATSVLPFVHEATGMPLDLVLAGSGLEQRFLDRAERVGIGDTLVPILRADDLLVAKILAGRPKDLEDVVSVLRERGDAIDLDAVRALLVELERALDQSDLTSALDNAVRRANAVPKR